MKFDSLQLTRIGARCLTGLLCVGLWACSSQPQPSDADRRQASRYQVDQDYGPDAPLDVSHVPDAIPKVEPRTSAGNKSPYTVLGQTYTLLPEDAPYVEEGMASWYGNKFHGHQTSNGEIYNMYGMTAAHKTLRIPSYVKVTNLDNQRSVIVRVNDRGPFHGDRIIDLSYAAARKLDYAERGTARVRVEAIDPIAWANARDGSTEVMAQAATVPPKLDGQTLEHKAPLPKNVEGYELPANTFLQAGAFSSKDSANSLRDQLGGLTHYPVFVAQASKNSLFRVRIGPITDNQDLMRIRELVFRKGGVRPHVVYQ
ncbi:septal ring lytic transglycosylase RlpA family protein [Simiduia aestuariiviva]|uniref:Endolytic peptidoglycan transglycosylase RlpA n=1 Tax=Simiduia aestuariiviva TaxID=1510459 RepID=A0A839UV97_9GAMM|nr:septal ring lytic transglycosylase RlpA family protein [Simiduia aestuariiviva]MBB3169275.1 rare lipoprotein A [Simiduia aestuariiviva]